MIPASRVSRPGVPALWAVPLGVLTGLVVGVFAGVVSGAVLLDVISWWPVWLVLGLLAWWARGRRLGMLRVSGLVPLVGTVAAVFFLVAHVQGWPLMPSASARVIGPEPDYARASLHLQIDGWIRLDGDGRFLYEVFPIRWGGRVSLPTAVEQTVEDTIGVDLREPGDSLLQRYRGWDVSLAAGPLWDLTLAGIVDADVSGLEVSRLRVSGAGTVTLGSGRAGNVDVSGEYTVLVPSGTPVRVVGDAMVPAGWTKEEDGWASPEQGAGWVVNVSPGSTVTVATRG